MKERFEQTAKPRTARGRAALRAEEYRSAARELLRLTLSEETDARKILEEDLGLEGKKLEEAIRTWRASATR